MMVASGPQVVQPITIYYQTSTTNQSFIDVSFQLKQKGVENNKFFLALYDKDLVGVDPRDPRLPQQIQAKVAAECVHNYWYFIREVVRIPDQGGSVGSGERYKLSRGNLALSFCLLNNWNVFLELPRQHGKTISAVCWYLWVFNFRTSNSEIMFMNKKHEDSKLNLQRLKDIRAALPSYLRFDNVYAKDGSKMKKQSNVESMTHIINNNKITTKSSARSRAMANNLGRGCTMPMHWYDEFAFILYNKTIYLAATPAYKRAAENAGKNHAPYSILITTTPGDLTSEEGLEAFKMKNSATPFQEEFYNYSPKQLEEVRNANNDSTFFYIRFTYQQLGSSEEYFKEMVKLLEKDWAAIRREVLLEWSETTDNSPFSQYDLDLIAQFCMKEPVRTVVLRKGFAINIYKTLDTNHFPPIIGVDVAGGYSKDSSALTIIDSRTTDVIADFNCNYISINDMASLIYELVMSYMPNAIVNIERNGGFGTSILSTLKNTKIKRNLYYEIKDRVLEERTFGGTGSIKRTKKMKVYGLDETKATRDLLMEILRERVENYKSKFISPIILSELRTLEVKKNGRIEHTVNGHDDQVFSYLLALYVWYEGKDLTERYGLEKSTIKSDQDEDIEMGIQEPFDDISDTINNDESIVQDQLNILSKDNSVLYQDWEQQERIKNQQAVNALLHTKLGQEAFINTYNADPDSMPLVNGGLMSIPQEVFDDYYSDFSNPQDKKKKIEEERINKIMSMKY